MRIIKPDTLAITYAVWPGHGDGGRLCRLVLACTACFPFARHVKALLDETRLWECAHTAIPSGFTFDEGRLKPRGEFLVYGACHASAAGETNAREVAVQVGKTHKKLAVFGPRFWTTSCPGTPAPFSSIPLTWENAFGGKEDAANPVGMGKSPDAEGRHPMPYVEQCGAYITSPTDKKAPAGLSAQGPSWSARRILAGARDRRWFETRWPDAPEDTHPEYFMLAPRDQWMPSFFRGDETFSMAGMHPEKETLQGMLPAIRCRMFVLRNRAEEAEFLELKNQADTLTLFPDSEIGALTFRGATHTCDEECADIAALLAVFEPSALPPESAEHYRRIIEETLNPPAPPPDADEKAEPLVEAEPAAKPESAAPEISPPDMPTPEVENLKQVVAEIEAQVSKHLAGLGVSREEAEAFLAKAGQNADAQLHSESSVRDAASLENEDPVASLRRLADELETYAHDVLRNSGKTKEEINAMLASKAELEPPDLAREFAPRLEDPDVPEEIKANLKKTMDSFAEVSTLCAALEELAQPDTPPDAGPADEPESEPDAAAAEPAADPLPTPLTREQVVERHAKGESLANTELSGLDLSGLDLSGADFREALLDGVRFVKSKLAGADLRGADCTQADFTEASLQSADVSGAIMQKAVLQKAAADKLVARGTRFQEADASDAVFTEADLEDADFTRAVMNRVHCAGVRAPQLRLQGALLQEADFTGANLHNARADANTDAMRANFSRADMALSGLRGANLAHAVLRDATLANADLGHCSLQKAVLTRAQAQDAKLFRADLSGACLRGADFSSTILRRAVLRDANLDGADLSGADLYLSVVNHASMAATKLQNTILDPAILKNFTR